MTDTQFTGWCITKDFLNEDPKYAEDRREGFGQTLEEANMTADNYASFMRRIELVTQLRGEDVRNPVKFRLYDDDDTLYYEGVCSLEILASHSAHGQDDLGNLPQMWAEADAGCTMIWHATENLSDDFLKPYRENDWGSKYLREQDGEEWVMIYG